MKIWFTIPEKLPMQNEIVFVRLNYWFGAPFKALWSSLTSTFTSSDNSLVYPHYSISRWKRDKAYLSSMRIRVGLSYPEFSPYPFNPVVFGNYTLYIQTTSNAKLYLTPLIAYSRFTVIFNGSVVPITSGYFSLYLAVAGSYLLTVNVFSPDGLSSSYSLTLSRS